MTDIFEDGVHASRDESNGSGLVLAQEWKAYSGPSLSFNIAGVVGAFESKVSEIFFGDSHRYIPGNGYTFKGPGQVAGVWDGVSYAGDPSLFLGDSAYLYNWGSYVYTAEDWRSEKFPVRVMVYFFKADDDED
jgi:hypothetical protein